VIKNFGDEWTKIDIVYSTSNVSPAMPRNFSGSNTKLRYRGDSARRRSLRRSRSFKVTNVVINQKPVCHFLLMNNTNLHPISHRFQVAQYWSNFCFRQRNLYLSVVSTNIILDHILPKTRCFGLHFLLHTLWV